MNKFQTTIQEIRKKARVRDYDPRTYVGYWSEKDVLKNEIVDALVIVLRTRGCTWALTGGCSMCGYINDCGQSPISSADILYQFDRAINKIPHSNHEILKIYTSGSFLDNNELAEDSQLNILAKLPDHIKKVIIESRPEFIQADKLEAIRSVFDNIEIAIGLESADDFVLKHSINKGFKFKNYLAAANLIKNRDLSLKTYLLIKPPFLTENESINDAVSSVKKLSDNELGGTISFNPVHIQNFTLVERLWHRQEYRPPWLWSVIGVIKKASQFTDARLMSAPTAGGKSRGSHNCGKCDSKVLAAINNFSLSNDTAVFNDLDCECRSKWLDIIELEDFAQSGGVFIY
jgi:radical SAM enzyme (TIGR01210 family)